MFGFVVNHTFYGSKNKINPLEITWNYLFLIEIEKSFFSNDSSIDWNRIEII